MISSTALDKPLATSMFSPQARTCAVARWHGFTSNQWLEPTVAVLMSTFDFMKQFPMFATLAFASGG
jgi:hypothetical protein